MFRVAIAGCGSIAAVHAKVLDALPETELIACCDIRRERAEALAKAYAMRAYENLQELVEKEAPDAVHLCTPHMLHTPMAEYCLRHGIHVFTEKPPVINREQWEVFRQLESYEKRVGICFQNRYNASVKEAKSILNSGRAGKILSARAILTWNREAAYYTESDWKGKWDTEGGGALINQAIHTLDLLVYLLGSVKQVQSHMCNHTLQQVIEVEDTVEALISFENGAGAVFFASNGYGANAPVLLEIVCENVTIRMENEQLQLTWKDGRKEQIIEETGTPLGKNYWGSSHYSCIQDFYRAIREGRTYQNDIQSVKETMELMLHMYDPYRNKIVGD